MSLTLDSLPPSRRPAARKILLIAGEESGDVYAGRLIAALRERIDGVAVEGIGGDRFRDAGGTTLHDMAELASVGLGAALGTIRKMRRLLAEFGERLDAGEYDAVILIDFPDFNLRLAARAQASATPVFYYVVPQLWAWRTWRINDLKKYADMVFPVFPFEAELYHHRGIDARFAGHPLLDELPPVEDVPEVRARFAGSAQTVVGLLPGSRRGEVARMLPVMLDALRLIRAKKPVKAIIPVARSLDPRFVRELVAAHGEEAQVVEGATWEAMHAVDLLIAKSGTTTLQAALAGAPMVVCYKADGFTYWLARTLSRVRWVAIPNLLAGREVVPELLQGNMIPRNIADAVMATLADPARRRAMREELLAVRAQLGEPGAARRAADAMGTFLEKMAERAP